MPTENKELKALWLAYVRAGLTGAGKERVGWEVFTYHAGKRIKDYHDANNVMTMIVDHEQRRVFKCLIRDEYILLMDKSIYHQKKILHADPDCFDKFKTIVDERLVEMKTVPNVEDKELTKKGLI